MLRSMLLLWATVFSVGLALTASGCKHPPEAGSADPHGTYTPEQARAAYQEHLKTRGRMGPGGGQAPHAGAPGNGAPSAVPN